MGNLATSIINENKMKKRFYIVASVVLIAGAATLWTVKSLTGEQENKTDVVGASKDTLTVPPAPIIIVETEDEDEEEDEATITDEVTDSDERIVMPQFFFPIKNAEPVSRAYWEVLTEEDRHGDGEYFLFDFTKNGIPELCVKTGTCEADYQLEIFSYSPKGGAKRVFYIDCGHSVFYSDKGHVIRVINHMGESLWTTISYHRHFVTKHIYRDHDLSENAEYREPSGEYIMFQPSDDKRRFLSHFGLNKDFQPTMVITLDQLKTELKTAIGHFQWRQWDSGYRDFTVSYPSFMHINKELTHYGNLVAECQWVKMIAKREYNTIPVDEKYEALKSGATTSSVGDNYFLLEGKIDDDMCYFEKDIKGEKVWYYLRVEYSKSLSGDIGRLLQYVRNYRPDEPIGK